MSHSISRRNVLQLAAAGLGATMGLRGTRLASASPTPETPKLLVLWFNGGWSQIFSDAGPLANKQFSVTDSNIFAPSPGCGFLADESFKELPAFALQRMASVGMNHMSTNHERATSLVLEAPNGLHYPKTLATAMGGSGPLKAAEICHEGAQPTHREHVETVRNIDGAMAALAGVLTGGPNRALAERGMVAARAMSQSRLAKNPFRLGPMREGYDVSVASLGHTLPAFDPVAIQNAYPAGPWDDGLPSRSRGGAFALAEILFRLGVNTVTIPFGAWDHHYDPQGALPRSAIKRVLPPLATLLSRMNDASLMPNTNLVTLMMGEFTRSTPDSDHGTCLSANVIGKYVRPGSTGQQDGAGNMQSTAKSPAQFWAFVSDALKLPKSPFGANVEHASLVA